MENCTIHKSLNSEDSVKTIELKAQRSNFVSFISFIERQLENSEIEKRKLTEILAASEEIIVNVIEYAYHDHEGKLKIDIHTYPEEIKITFSDYGLPFNPLEIKDPDTNLGLYEREVGGLGILLFKNLVDDVHYEFNDEMNHTTIIKRISVESIIKE